MTKTHKERLLKLYNYMKQPQKYLGHDDFYFGAFDYSSTKCGTAGCMAGELPFLFPKEWALNRACGYSHPVLMIGSGVIDTDDGLERFFGLTPKEVSHLFYPLSQSKSIDPDCEILSDDATKEDVAKNLYRFLKIKGILK